MAGRCSLTPRRGPRPIAARWADKGACGAPAGLLRVLLLLLPAATRAQLPMQPNQTTVECEALAIARSSRANDSDLSRCAAL